jgi:hypothetical protein
MTSHGSRERCDRCGTPIEAPVTFADEICGPYPDYVSGVCGHVPICQDCGRLHTGEVIEEITYARRLRGIEQVPLTPIEQQRPTSSEESRQ